MKLTKKEIKLIEKDVPVPLKIPSKVCLSLWINCGKIIGIILIIVLIIFLTVR